MRCDYALALGPGEMDNGQDQVNDSGSCGWPCEFVRRRNLVAPSHEGWAHLMAGRIVWLGSLGYPNHPVHREHLVLPTSCRDMGYFWLVVVALDRRATLDDSQNMANQIQVLKSLCGLL